MPSSRAVSAGCWPPDHHRYRSGTSQGMRSSPRSRYGRVCCIARVSPGRLILGLLEIIQASKNGDNIPREPSIAKASLPQKECSSFSDSNRLTFLGSVGSRMGPSDVGTKVIVSRLSVVPGRPGASTLRAVHLVRRVCKGARGEAKGPAIATGKHP